MCIQQLGSYGEPTPVLLPGKSHGWKSLVGCSPWGREESETTERLHLKQIQVPSAFKNVRCSPRFMYFMVVGETTEL